MTTNSLKAFKSLLHELNSLVKKLLALAEDELEALKTNDLKKLQEVVSQQQFYSDELFELEKKRMVLQGQLAQEYGLEPNLSLKELLASQLLERENLEEVGSELLDNFAKLKEANELNNMLIRQSLAYINKVLKAVLPQGQATYSPRGEINTTEALNVKLDKSV